MLQWFARLLVPGLSDMVEAMRLADFPNVKALSTIEKLQLVDEIWADIGADVNKAEASVTEKRLLDERWAKYEQNPESALTLNELKRKIEESRE